MSPKTILAFRKARHLPSEIDQTTSRRWFDEAYKEYLEESRRIRGTFEDESKVVPSYILHKKMDL